MTPDSAAARPLLLAFGDSNTHGSPPVEAAGLPGAAQAARHAAADRWPRIAADALGWDVVEEGLPGRTAQFSDPVMGAHMDGRVGLRIALASHGPIDALAIMLGTNDVKTRFGADVTRVTAGIAGLLDVALGLEMQGRHGGFPVLLIAPPPIREIGPFAGEFHGAEVVARGLAPAYQALADARGCGFLDAGQVAEVSPVDGIHFQADGQHAIGRAAARALATL